MFNNHFSRIIAAGIAVIILCLSELYATAYYVSQGDSNANDGNDGSLLKPWKTITKANAIAAAGDSVIIKAGVYHSSIIPKNSGTSLKPIVYCNYESDSVTIADTVEGITLNAKSYIVVHGISFFKLDYFLTIQNRSHHNTIEFCNFDQGRNVAWCGSAINGGSCFNRIHHCRFSKYGLYDDHARKCVFDIGNEYSSTDSSQFNIIENCVMYHGGHHVLGIYGSYNVIRNNYMHNEAWANGYGERVTIFAGHPPMSGWNLFDNNRIGYAAIPPANPGSSGIQVCSSNNIIRRNSFFYNNLSGIQMSVTSTYFSDINSNMIYNNSFLSNGWNPPSGAFCPDAMCSAIGMAIYSGTWVIKNNAFLNNLFLNHPISFGYYHVNATDQVFRGNWNGDTLGNPLYIKGDNNPGSPMDTAYPDLHLRDNSPCKDTASYLTIITSAGGSGKTFTVANSHFFMNGWGIPGVSGDEIQLYKSKQRAIIIKIDYASNTLTTNQTLTWEQNQGVCLAYEGNGPDVGAYELMQLSIKKEAPKKRNPRAIKTISSKTELFLNPSGWLFYDPAGKTIVPIQHTIQKNFRKNGIVIAYSKYDKVVYLFYLQ